MLTAQRATDESVVINPYNIYVLDLVSECADDSTNYSTNYDACCYRCVGLVYYYRTSWWRRNRTWSWIVANYFNYSAVPAVAVIHSAYIIVMLVIVTVVNNYLMARLVIVTWLIVSLSETVGCEHCHHSDDHHALEIHCLHCTFVLYC